MTHAPSQMPELKPCRCHSYNWEIGEEKNVVVDAPHWSEKKRICLDACIADTIKELWKRGIITLGSCCGHNKATPDVIVCESQGPNAVLAILSEIDPRDWEVSRWERVIYTPTPDKIVIDRGEFIQQLIGRAKFCEDRGEVKTPELLRKAASLIAARVKGE